MVPNLSRSAFNLQFLCLTSSIQLQLDSVSAVVDQDLRLFESTFEFLKLKFQELVPSEEVVELLLEAFI